MNIAVIFGGKSNEYEVSCLSAACVLENITGHNIYRFAVTKNGEWYLTEASNEDIRNGKWTERKNKPLTADLTAKKFICEGKPLNIDAAFPLIHGRNGEDGRLQGLLELMDIKYVGSGVLGSAVCMDKITANKIFEYAGIKHVPWFSVTKKEYEKSRGEIHKKAAESYGFPVFIKPSNAGSSLGITKCRNEDDLVSAFRTAFDTDSRVIVEKGLENPDEIEISVLGNEEPETSSTGKILSANEIYDYEAKYINESSKTLIPSGISAETEETIKKLAVKAYKACDCRGLSRVDFLIDKSGEIYINEINTIPGFTKISMYPKLLIAAGIKYSELIDKLLEYALEN